MSRSSLPRPPQENRGVVKAQALLRGYLTRRAYAQLLSKKHARDITVKQILQTEEKIVSDLDMCKKEYITPLRADPKKYGLTNEEISIIFSNIDSIANIHQKLLLQLSECIAKWDDSSTIGNRFSQIAPFFKQLSGLSQSSAEETLAKLRVERKAFGRFLKQIESKPNVQPLLTLLGLPLEHIHKYEQNLKEMVDNTWDWHRDFDNLVTASRDMRNVVEHIAQAKKVAENQNKLLQIQNDLGGTYAVVTPTRQLIMDGILMRSKPNKQLWVYLFNDGIVFAAKSIVGRLRFVESFNISDVVITQNPPSEFFSLSGAGSTNVYMLAAGSSEESQKWIDTINAAVEVEKKKLGDIRRSRANSASVSFNNSVKENKDLQVSQDSVSSKGDSSSKLLESGTKTKSDKDNKEDKRASIRIARSGASHRLIENFDEEESRIGTSIKKRIATDLLKKAFVMLGEEKVTLAKCYLTISADIYDSLEPEDLNKRNHLIAEIQQRESLSEYEVRSNIEAKVGSVKSQIAHALQQVSHVRSSKEKQMIDKQLEILRSQEKELEAQLRAIEQQNKELQEREQQILHREQLVSEQTKHLETMLVDFIATSSGVDTTALQQQMSSVVAGDKDVDVARRRFAGLQKAAKDAQNTLVVEERRQRDRVEWFQKQMELYKVKGMSPAQLAFRNFLKDVKRLSSVRHHMEHTPYPLRCFISYAWETDSEANKVLQQRLERLKENLEMAGMEVTLDVHNMKDSMKNFMLQGIKNSHKVLLICTPRLKVRAADPTKNNLQLELEAALEKSKTTPDFIVPLIFNGTFRDSLPPQVEELLSINFTNTEDPQYYEAIASLNPMGLIPMLLDLPRNKEYKNTANRFFGDLKDFH